MRIRVIAPALAGALLAATLLAHARATRTPVFVGSRVCASCHDGAHSGHQHTKWLASKHSQAWAVLAKPGTKEIARLSGISDEPTKAPICLGCHATAWDAEPWQKDPTFAIEDGIQCERCHGAGSEYMDIKIMMDRSAAMKAGLKMPTKRDCALCHYVKGSHVAVHHLPALDIDEAWNRIAHPTPEKMPEKLAEAKAEKPPTVAPDAKEPALVGALACAQCHTGPEHGHQYAVWRMSSHAKAWTSLTSDRAKEIAKKAGVSGSPQDAAACLKCHSTAAMAAPRAETFAASEGVSCESCHGAGALYMSEPVMRDRRTAIARGMNPSPAQSCATCHANAHGKPFDPAMALPKIAHPSKPKAVASAPRYKTPLNLAFRPDGKEVWTACEASDTVIVIDAERRRKAAEISVGGQPADVAFSPDGKRAFVSNRLSDSVSVIDVATRQVERTISVGDEPHGLITNRSGSRLFVLNTASENVSVIDTSTWEEVGRPPTSRSPWSLALSPDGTRIAITNSLSRLGKFRSAPVSEITLLDAETGNVVNRAAVPEANLLLGVSWHPSGDFALFTLNRTKNLVPMTRMLQGWTITNGLGILWKDGRVDQVLLDQPNLYFSDSFDVTFTPDGRNALATSSGTDRLAVIDVSRLRRLFEEASEDDRREVIPNHLGKSALFVSSYVPTKDSPRGVTVAPDGRTAWVANALDDTLSVIDVATWKPTHTVDLGGPKVLTKERRGEKLFNGAEIAFQRQLSCHSCHPDGHVDGLTYDIEADGIGINPVDNRTLRGIYDTDPFKWEGTNPSLARQCGARLAVFFTRVAPFTPDELDAVNDFTVTIPRPPNRYRPLGAPLTPAQRRGRAMFERTHLANGAEIPVDNRCITCHFPPYYTDRSVRDVGSRYELDRHGRFDVPHLNNIYDSAPYMHNGMANTLEEIWTRFNPYDTHGVTNDMTKDQLNDLIEYLKTL